MKRFRFPLESVRTLRGLREQRAREAVATALRELDLADRRHTELSARRRALSDGMLAARSGTFRPSDQAAAIAALDVAIGAEAEAAKARAAAVTALDGARDKWLETRRQLEVIHRLEERAHHAHDDAAEKAEQASLDEFATIGASRVPAWKDSA